MERNENSLLYHKKKKNIQNAQFSINRYIRYNKWKIKIYAKRLSTLNIEWKKYFNEWSNDYEYMEYSDIHQYRKIENIKKSFHRSMLRDRENNLNFSIRRKNKELIRINSKYFHEIE